MKRILMVIPSLGSGGAERQASIVARYLHDRNHQVELCMWCSSLEYEIPKAVRIHIIPRTRKWQAATAVVQLAGLIRRSAPDAVYSQVHFTNLITATALRLARSSARFVCRLTVAPRQVIPRGMVQISRNAYGRANCVIACSHGVASEAVSFLKISPERVCQLDNLVDVDAIRKASECDVEPAAKTNDVTLIQVGRMVSQKNHRLLLDALAVLRREPIHVWFLGEGPLRSELRRYSQKLDVEHKITWLGRKTNPFPFVRAADCLVLTSDFEGLPNVIIEAMICKTPVIATDCPYGPGELVQPEITGWLIPPGDLSALVKTLRGICARPDRLKTVAEAAYCMAINRFGAKRHAQRFEAVICGSGQKTEELG